MPDKKLLKVLLVEDNDADAHFIGKALSHKKFEVVRLADGQAALDYLLNSEEEIGVVLIDYKLPFVDGLEVIKESRKKGKNYPFIFLTVDSNIDTAVEAMKAGALDFLPKIKGYTGLSDMIEKVHRIHRAIIDKSILEKQLQNRQKMDTLVTLTRCIVHDFNNILTVMEGNISLLLLNDSNFTEKQLDFLKNIDRACGHAVDLAKQLRKINRDLPSEKINIDFYEIAHEVFSLLENTTDKIIEKKLEIESGEFIINANPSEINQILLNLGINAIKAIEERGTRPGDYIKVSAENYIQKNSDRMGLQNGEYVHILFEDNGKGMTEEVKRKAFDPYFTTRTQGEKEGQGLGLTMVNKIVREHKGYIYIESEAGKKTTFHIFFPKSKSKKETKIEKDIEVRGGSETVLVIDDEKMVRDYAVSILESYGYKTLTANDGSEGLKLFNIYKDSIDIVILDLILPKISGNTVFEGILKTNENGEDKHTKIIISSGLSDEEIHNSIFTKASGFVPKPYTEKELAQTVRIALDL